MKKNLFFIVVFFHCSFSFAQKNSDDSLSQLLSQTKTDSLKIKILNEYIAEIIYDNTSKAQTLAWQEMEIAKKSENKKGLADAHSQLGLAHDLLFNYDSAFHHYKFAKKLYEELEDKNGIATVYLNTGVLHYLKGDYDKAMENYILSLNIREEMKDENSMSMLYSNIGMLQKERGNIQSAIEYYSKSLEIELKNNDKKGYSKSYNNLGNCYRQLFDYKKAMEYYLLSLKYKHEINDRYGLAGTYNNIGLIYSEEKNFHKAIEFYMKALEIEMEFDDKREAAGSYINIGEAFIHLNDYRSAIKQLEKGLNISVEIGNKEYAQFAYEGLAVAYEKINDFQKSNEYLKLFVQTKDSILNIEKNRQMTEMQTKYETGQKEKQIEIQNLQLTQQELEINKKQITIYAVSLGLTLMLALAFVIYRGYSQKKKLNEQLTEQNIIIEQKNKDITDSIEYGKTLQDAILPDIANIKKTLPNSFVFFRPRDIVSGDFYWFHRSADLKSVLLAAADCTGHGVPGAFVSMVCNNVLNNVVLHRGITQPGEILSQVNRGVSEAFRKEGTKSKANDGMDIALVRIEFEDRLPTNLQYAGAMNSALIVRNGEAIELPADKMSIGGHTPVNYQFKNHEILLQKNDSLYIFSDGFHDQFGGAKGKKFMYRRFKELLVKISVLNADEQMKELEKAFLQWQGNHERVDDVLVIGIKV